MTDSRMGSLLRGRREELGISLEMAATATNIRARVLAVLENGDYGNFPPYGHALGMISSYARYLETDPRPILQEFEREWADYEASRDMAQSAERTRRGVGRFGERATASERPSQRSARARASERRGRGADQGTGTIHAKLDDERVAEQDDRYKSGTVKVVGTRQTGTFHRVGARRPKRDAGTRGASSPVARERAGAPAESGSNSPSRRSGRGGSPSRYSRYGSRYASGHHPTGSARRAGGDAPDSAARARHHADAGAAREGQAPDFFSPEALERRSRPSDGSRRSERRRPPVAQRQQVTADDGIVARATAVVTEAFSERRVRVIALGIAAFVIVVAIAAGILISTAGNDNGGVIAVDGGAADTTKTTGDPNSASATVTTTNGNPVNVAIDVGQGQTSLVNVTYDDDNAYSGTAVGPWHREFLVTESLEATFGNPDAVTVTENGTSVPLEKSSDGTGSMSLTIKTTSTSTSAGSSEETGSKKGKRKASKKSSKGSSSSSSES